MTEPRITLIAAVSENGVIGRDLDMPWKLSTDLKRFKSLTMGKPMIMGRKTFLSVGERPLPGRPHIIISRNPDYRPQGVDVVSSLENARKHLASMRFSWPVAARFTARPCPLPINFPSPTSRFRWKAILSSRPSILHSLRKLRKYPRQQGKKTIMR